MRAGVHGLVINARSRWRRERADSSASTTSSARRRSAMDRPTSRPAGGHRGSPGLQGPHCSWVLVIKPRLLGSMGTVSDAIATGIAVSIFASLPAASLTASSGTRAGVGAGRYSTALKRFTARCAVTQSSATSTPSTPRPIPAA